MIRPQRMIYSLRTPNFNEMLLFYQNLLGTPRQQISQKWASFRLPGSELLLWRAPHFQPMDGGMQMCLVVEHLINALTGLSPVGAIQEASHGQEAFVQDPDGNTLILYQPHEA